MEETMLVIDPLKKLTKDLKESVNLLSQRQVRFLVDFYYQMQDFRIQAGNQVRASEEEPHGTIAWVFDNMKYLENNIKNVLGRYANTQEAGKWSMSILGVSDILSAGLLAYIDMDKAKYYTKIIRFMGHDPTIEWLGAKKAKALIDEIKEREGTEDPEAILLAAAGRLGRNYDSLRHQALFSPKTQKEEGTLTMVKVQNVLARRPWNARLKVLAWKIGESFVKVSNRPGDFYGKHYKQQYELITARNERGEFAEYATQRLRDTKFGPDTEAYKAYKEGRLPKGQIHARAQRYAVKLFINHWHHVAYEAKYNEKAPLPFIIEHGGHKDIVLPPNHECRFK